MTENQIAKIIVDACYKIHLMLGPGLFESVYETCLAHELVTRGLVVERQKKVQIIYEGVKLENAYRLDLCVENKVIVELKSVEMINALCISQMLTYLKFSELKLGLIVNFNTAMIKDGIKRVVSGVLVN